MVFVLVSSPDVSGARKVTVELPADLLRRAQKSTGDGVTSTIRRGLELVAAGEAYRGLRRLKGKVSLSLDLDTLRTDDMRSDDK